ncbi:3-ketoacyl-CoA thiolase [Phocoenobacter uteri]|uniref:3-ketoacyl-CoA thiolase n=1 Tax=Phocoenobacter uteri TaxID=146806 RepID=A0A379CAS1_9PAST|nr:acetyl-CoA C-acyltransferase [Phocoenobacter uteri]MDG6881237.1 acetyl-CoA acetyltransferase [Phocoenobacter uteri]SUB59259.1 3-ketoacyl-CoA thiolase [Phocoenobacter uteri]
MIDQHLLTARSERVAIISGVRTPFAERDSAFKEAYATDLGTMITNELLSRTPIDRKEISQLVFGQVIQQPDIPNLAREIALSLSMPHLQAYTLSSSCISGMQAFANVASSIVSGSITTGIAGGADSISNAPFSLSPLMVRKIKGIFRQKTLERKYELLRQLSWRDLKPNSVNLKDYMTQLSVSDISEQMAQYYGISRQEQDDFARLSNQNAQNAWKIGLFKDEVISSFPRPYNDFVVSDNLNPKASRRRYYEGFSPLSSSDYATVTSANISQPADGAAAILLMNESRAKALGLKPLGYIKSYAITGNDIWENMFVGSVISSAKALDRVGLQIQDLDYVDIHETSASQVLANLQLFESQKFAKNHLNRTACLGEIDRQKLNHLGGSIAFGNPRAVSSLRLVIQSLNALKRKGGGVSLVASGGLGGLGAAMILESEG